MKYLLALWMSLSLLLSCEQEAIPEPINVSVSRDTFDVQYAFFTAGHTYGNPFTPQYGLYPPFLTHVSFLNNYPAMQMGVLTGDVVLYSTPDYWDAAVIDMNQFTMPLHIAAGNHDRGPEFDARFDSYYSFFLEDDLHIVLSPTNWSITGDQKAFLETTLSSNADLVNNIFIYCHELLWWAPDNEFGNIVINFAPHFPGSSNYWPEISPLLEHLPNNVVIYAGDLGAKLDVDPYMYYAYQNISLIAGGMGGGVNDNIVITQVSKTGEVRHKLLGINGEKPTELAKLEDYKLP